MEYLLRSGGSFEQLEARIIEVLGRQGFMVRRSFSLHSATRGELGLTFEEGGGPPGFSVLWLYASGARRQSLALVTLYERHGRTIFQVIPASTDRSLSAVPEPADLEAELTAALVLDGLEVCRGLDGSRGCVDAARVLDDTMDEPALSSLQEGRGWPGTPSGDGSPLGRRDD
jgi:hypothetical protein